MKHDTKKLSIVIPVYNEQEILKTEIEKIIAEAGTFLQSSDYEIVLVENGSSDDTLSIAKKLASQYYQINPISLSVASYGNALKEGVSRSNGTYIAVFNIDFWDMDAVKKAITLFENEGCDIVVCSKSMEGALDKRPLSRRILKKIFNFALRMLFRYPGTDTHGIKIFNREKAAPVFSQCKTHRDLLDTEFLIRANRAGLKIKEIPVTCEEKRKSVYGIFGHIPRIIKDFVVIFFDIYF
ncbi:MAG: glycosyltransferase [Candidatus Lloydbacteria bacterium]|nr:glycosyltransferase [Candidatus Lloydbacteria bacterium]